MQPNTSTYGGMLEVRVVAKTTCEADESAVSAVEVQRKKPSETVRGSPKPAKIARGSPTPAETG